MYKNIALFCLTRKEELKNSPMKSNAQMAVDYLFKKWAERNGYSDDGQIDNSLKRKKELKNFPMKSNAQMAVDYLVDKWARKNGYSEDGIDDFGDINSQDNSYVDSQLNSSVSDSIIENSVDSMLENPEDSGIMEMKSTQRQGDKLRSYTERGIELPERNRLMLEKLQNPGDYIDGNAGEFEIGDLKILSTEADTKFACVTVGGKSYLIKGDGTSTIIPDWLLDKMKKENGILDFHSHPFADDIRPSISDKKLLRIIRWQETSKIIDQSGHVCIFNKNGIINEYTLETKITEADKNAYEKLFGGD